MNLNKGLFTPVSILLSILFVPGIVLCSLLGIVDNRIELIIISVIMLFCYFVAIALLINYTNSQKNTLVIDEESIIINYPRLYRKTLSKIEIIDIVNVEYYRISSIRAWAMLYNCIFPQCAFVTYTYKNEEKNILIGYPKFKELKRMCDELKIKLVIK